MEIIASLVEGGCYSAVFAVLLLLALKTNSKREECYRSVISGLTDALRELDGVSGRLDELIALCESIADGSAHKAPAASGTTGTPTAAGADNA